MENPFDIIKVLTGDDLAWVEAANELTAARVRVWELLADSPGEYIIFNQDTKTLVAHFSIDEAPQTPEWWRHDDDCLDEPQPPVPEFDEDYAEELQPAVA